MGKETDQERTPKIEATVYIMQSEKWHPIIFAIFFIKSNSVVLSHTQGEKIIQQCG